MTGPFVLWRCLHSGPLSADSIDRWSPDSSMPWQELRDRNVPLLTKLAEMYGAYAIVARDGDQIVGQLRFYPEAIASMAQAGQWCLQQAFPAGPAPQLAERRFPALAEIEDKTLTVHCLMVGSPSSPDKHLRHRGIATRMVRELIRWAAQQGWTSIEAPAYEDLPILYDITGVAGKRFWEKLGFQIAHTGTEPGFLQEGELLRAMREQAIAQGLDQECVMNLYTMQINLT